MNDRFRFRVWDEESSEYLVWGYTPDYQLEIDLTNGKLVWQYVPDDGEESPRELDTKHLVIEQCTGLKDKNGKLIYEGDIVESYGEFWKCVFEMNHGYGIDSPGFVLKNNFGHAQPFRNIQVVGNIHKNPELLEV